MDVNILHVVLITGPKVVTVVSLVVAKMVPKRPGLLLHWGLLQAFFKLRGPCMAMFKSA
jgi:hypothetical protein